MDEVKMPGLVGLGDILGDVILDLYKEGPKGVVEKVTKAQYSAYVCITYTKTPGGFTIQGQLQMIEKLLCPIYQSRGSSGSYVDGIVLRALTTHAQYDRAGKSLKRKTEQFYHTDGDALEFMKFVKVRDYKPPCLVYAKLDDESRDKLLDRDAGLWEDYTLMAERELRQRCRSWKQSSKPKKRTINGSESA